MSRTSWKRAQSFEGLCELGARFVEGREHSFPGWGARGLDAESLPLVPALAALNRAGFLTLASQPGTLRGVDGCEQRAFASGFCSARDARRLSAKGARCFSRGAAGRAGVAVSRRDGAARVLAGHNAFEEELELFRGAVGSAALAELGRGVYWSIWDPVWGREEWLWRRLARLWS
ncbi:MAG: hypothetical protein IPJ19_00205 [Planctomycetes bacterium]|nr:hypothetical protein [Planctomycetota bacterium]